MNGRPDVEARLGRILRGLARRLSAREDSVAHSEWTRKLLRHMRRYAPPEARGPCPTAILLHGCAGDPRHLASWGRLLARNGILAYTIDSLTPRGIGPLAARLLVCTGLRLRGRERCRDLTQVLPEVLADPRVDRDRISLVGWSHGAWTITEWMLDDTAGAFATRAGLSIRSVVLAYPYCGIASTIHEKAWTGTGPVMVVMGGEDVVVSNQRTGSFVESLSRGNVPVEPVSIDGVGHGFDVEGNGNFNAAKTRELQAHVLAFLRKANG